MTLFAMIAFAAAVGFLVVGIASMAQGGESDFANATRYMAGRVAMQAAAFALLLLAMLAVTS